MKLAPDATIADGRYRLTRQIGAGGMASVWLAMDERLGRPVAIKIVADTLAADPHWVKRFTREAQAAARLSHPGIVSVYDYGLEDDRPYLVMEHVPGVDLARKLANKPRLQTALAERLARELLDAVGCVHAADILHRDIKPANVLLDEQDRVRLTDFGIALAADATSLTQTGMVIGTLRYLAPEVTAGQPASIASDLYSTGMIIRALADAAPSPKLAELAGALTATEPQARPHSAADALGWLEPPSGATGTGTTRIARPVAPDPTAQTTPLPTATARQPNPPDHQHPARDRQAPTPQPWHSGSRPIRLRPAVLMAAGAALLLLVILLAATRGSSPTASRSVPPAAKRDAPLDQQLRALDRIVSAIAER